MDILDLKFKRTIFCDICYVYSESVDFIFHKENSDMHVMIVSNYDIYFAYQSKYNLFSLQFMNPCYIRQ